MYKLTIELETGCEVLEVEQEEVFDEIMEQYETADMIAVEGVDKKLAFRAEDLITLELK